MPLSFIITLLAFHPHMHTNTLINHDNVGKIKNFDIENLELHAWVLLSRLQRMY